MIINKVKTYFKNKYLYWLSFLLPTCIFASYFLYRGQEILTVDLGQQYIDFLSFYKNNLLSNPLNFIFTFSNGLGSSFIGTSASLDFASKIVCQQGCCSPLLEAQSQGDFSLWIPHIFHSQADIQILSRI